MERYIPGSVSQLASVDAGTCVLFEVSGAFHAGLVIQAADGSKSIVDFEADDSNGGTKFHIYNLSSFQNDTALCLNRSRVVPSLGAGELGLGTHSRGRISKALYLTEFGLVVYAGYQHTAYKIDITSGSIYRGDIGYDIHTTNWRIDIEDGAGKYQTLRQFLA